MVRVAGRVVGSATGRCGRVVGSADGAVRRRERYPVGGKGRGRYGEFSKECFDSVRIFTSSGRRITCDYLRRLGRGGLPQIMRPTNTIRGLTWPPTPGSAGGRGHWRWWSGSLAPLAGVTAPLALVTGLHWPLTERHWHLPESFLCDIATPVISIA